MAKKKSSRGKASNARQSNGKKSTAGNTRRRKSGTLRSASLSQLEAEILRRQDKLEDLEARREELLVELRKINGEIGKLRGRGIRSANDGSRANGSRSSGRGRGRNRTSLVETLTHVLDGKTLSVSSAADAALESGYTTRSPNFRTIVNQALLANPETFRKVSHGKYTLKA
ncbi:MAG: hypothetical protein ACYTGC_13425 [Planctomycetota bacterium]|jgi:hypothetical protein